MKKILFSLLASIGFLAAQNDVIVDNQQASFEGKWETSKSSKDRYGDDYRSSFCVAGASTATATFQPNITVPGKYDVEVMYPRGDNRSAKAPWLISFKGGTIQTNITQKVLGGKWVRIGKDLEFAAGKEGYVQLSNNSGEDKETSFGRTVVVADAVRLTPSGGGVDPNAATTPVKDAPAWRYAIQTSVQGSGSVLKNPDQPGYSAREIVQLTAQPQKGHVFVGWTGDASGMDNPLKIALTNNFKATAEFLPEAIGVIMESSEAQFVGQWTPNSQKWVGQRSSSYMYAAASSQADAFVTYRPKLPKAGKYDVYIYFLQGENRATRTTWEITCRTGKSKTEIDQRKNGRQWVLLGAGKEFDAGSAGYVKATNFAEPIPSVVVADSVAFVYAGPLDSK